MFILLVVRDQGGSAGVEGAEGAEVSATQPNHLLLQQVQRPVSRRSLWAASSGASSPLSVHFN